MPLYLRTPWLCTSIATVALLTLGSGCIVGFKVDSSTSASQGDTLDKESESDPGSTTLSSSSTDATESGASQSGTNSGTSGSTSDSGTTAETTGGTGATDTSATSGTSGTTGGVVGECQLDADCELFTDCCSCQAAPFDDPPAMCDLACEETRCEALGITTPLCNFGVCATSRVNCDDSQIVCNVPPPECLDGLLPQVNEGGDCWTGQCVRGIQCESVASCDGCPDADWTCVAYEAFTKTYRCEPIPAGCEDEEEASCGCAGKSYCTDGFNECSEGVDGITCTCLDC